MLVCRDSESGMASSSSETEATPPRAANVSQSNGSGTNGRRAHPSKPQASFNFLHVYIDPCAWQPSNPSQVQELAVFSGKHGCW